MNGRARNRSLSMQLVPAHIGLVATVAKEAGASTAGILPKLSRAHLSAELGHILTLFPSSGTLSALSRVSASNRFLAVRGHLPTPMK